MVADFYFVRHRQVKLSDLYKIDGSYHFWHGVNWRAFPAWIIGWGPTIGGMALNVKGDGSGPRVLYQLFYVSFFYGAWAFVPLVREVC